MSSIATHPIVVAGFLRERYGDELTLQFSRYFYRPRSVFDEREVFEVNIWEISDSWLEAQFSSLRPGWELALNSLVISKGGRRLHLPMIDFVGKDLGVVGTPRFTETVGRKLTSEMLYFDSGRSVHAYSITLLTRSNWVKYMGRLLLLNEPGEKPRIDSRWIGHRLHSGYAALRWSKNTNLYTSLPVRIRDIG